MIAALALAGCTAGQKPALTWDQVAAANPAPTVTASGQTDAVATTNADAANDPAIWRNAANPSASLIVGTDKKAGLNVYDLDGRLRGLFAAGRVNNVDLIETTIAGRPGVLVAASDRNDPANAKVALFQLDIATGRLDPLGTVPAGKGEGYGMCLAARDGGVDAFMVLKDGTINQVALDLAAAPGGRIVRTMKLATQSEGCVVDPAAHQLYVAEEDVGVWRFDARPDAPTTPMLFAKVDGRNLVADSEGIALADGLLLVSSQGDMPMPPTPPPMAASSGAFASDPARSARRAKPTGSRRRRAISARPIRKACSSRRTATMRPPRRTSRSSTGGG